MTSVHLNMECIHKSGHHLLFSHYGYVHTGFYDKWSTPSEHSHRLETAQNSSQCYCYVYNTYVSCSGPPLGCDCARMKHVVQHTLVLKSNFYQSF